MTSTDLVLPAQWLSCLVYLPLLLYFLHHKLASGPKSRTTSPLFTLLPDLHNSSCSIMLRKASSSPEAAQPLCMFQNIKLSLVISEDVYQRFNPTVGAELLSRLHAGRALVLQLDQR